MTSHTKHPPIAEQGLNDHCPRCHSHAKHPTMSLDAANLAALWERMLAVEYDDPSASYRSYTERKACLALYDIARFLERCEINPNHIIPTR